MYLIKISGLGFIHDGWQDSEPRFCTTLSAAKSWPTLETALAFGNHHLTPRLALGWELWQETEDDLLPVMRPKLKAKN
ncbi:MAG: hypothetical protein AAF152_14735 [Cyanobacteria bacterium P01_A01_bin.114]